MDINRLKPDFKKISFALGINNVTDASVSENPDFFTRSLRKDWNAVVKGEVTYELKDNVIFKSLITEYSLKTHYNDLLFLAFLFVKRSHKADELREFIRSVPVRKKELLYALKFLYENELKDIRVIFRRKTKNISTPIDNLLLVNVIRKALLEEYIENDIDFQQGFMDPEAIRDWDEYFNLVIIEEEAKEENKESKKKPAPGSYIDILQSYLQEYTDMKADKEVLVSHEQASFMFKYLSTLGLIKDKEPWDEDNIRQMLTKYRELKMKKFPFDYKQFMLEYSQFMTGR
jgi:hypothetical protein